MYECIVYVGVGVCCVSVGECYVGVFCVGVGVCSVSVGVNYVGVCCVGVCWCYLNVCCIGIDFVVVSRFVMSMSGFEQIFRLIFTILFN